MLKKKKICAHLFLIFLTVIVANYKEPCIDNIIENAQTLIKI